MKRFYFLALAFLFIAGSAFAQTASLKRGKQMMKDLDYTGAIKLYNQILEHSDNSEAKINLAECYRKVGDSPNAEYWFGQVVRLAEAEPIHYLYYGQALQQNGKCDLAKEWFTKYTTAVPDDVRGQYLDKACDYEQELLTKNASIYEVKRTDFNSNFDDFGAAFYKDGLIFASERDRGAAIKREHTWTGYPFLDLYFVDMKEKGDNLIFGRPEKFTKDINSKYHDATVSLSKDQSQIYFTRNNYKDGKTGKDDQGIIRLKVYSAKTKGNDGWSDEESLPFNSDEYSVAHPALSADGTKLYFASDMPGGFGGMDLYVSEQENGRWGPPMNLGPKINTEGNEIFPFIHSSGRLYFSSNGHIGLGGLDIFYVEDKGNSEWSDPENLGFPVNTKSDDFGFVLNDEGSKGFLSSDREGGAGRDDIYSFKKTAVPVEIYVYDLDTKLPIEGAVVLDSCTNRQFKTGANGRITVDVKFNTCCTFTASKETYTDNKQTACIKDANTNKVVIEIPLQKMLKFDMEGFVFDLSTGLPLDGAKVTLLSDVEGEEPQTFTTDNTGRFHFDLKKDATYKVKAEKDSYFAQTIENQTTKDLKESTTLKTTINLQPTNMTAGGGNNGGPSIAGFTKDPSTGIYKDQTGNPANGTFNGITFKDGEIVDKGGNQFFENGVSKPDEQGNLAYLLHIYYDFDQSFIRDDAVPELEKLQKLLADNPTYIIEIGSHTDSRGSNNYNYRLSQRRAESVVRWLTDKGIEIDRLVPRGYGETKNVNGCTNNVPCSEKDHQLNRRTEFKVLGCKGCIDEKNAVLSRPNENVKVDPCHGCPF